MFSPLSEINPVIQPECLACVGVLEGLESSVKLAGIDSRAQISTQLKSMSQNKVFGTNLHDGEVITWYHNRMNDITLPGFSSSQALYQRFWTRRATTKCAFAY